MRSGFVAAWLTALAFPVAGHEQTRGLLGNFYTLKTEDGAVVLEFISSSSFRFARRWGEVGGGRRPLSEEKVPFTVKEAQDVVEFSTRYLRVELEKTGRRLRVRDAGGRLLLADLSGPSRSGEGILWERQQFEGESFRGLGPAADPGGFGKVESRIETDIPFLVSSLGYGEYFRPRGVYRYEFGGVRRVLAPDGPESECFFYYGPTLREILEQHAAVEQPVRRVDWAMFRLRESRPQASLPLPTPSCDWEGLASLVRWVQQASYSAMLLPAVDVDVWSEAPREIAERARGLAVLLPVIYGRAARGNSAGSLGRERERWVPFLVSYGYEAQERGYPLVRPLEMQYPKDPEAGRRHDQFMVGDELLVAPLLGPERVRKIYLPPGQWTEWYTHKRYAGRQVVELEACGRGIVLFVKNGSLLPVAEGGAGGLVAVHYFPRLAGEFFFYEEGDGALTQLHAAPAGEWFRLEIEPARERTWEWVVHHVERPRRVWSGDRNYREARSREELSPGLWWHDESKKNLHVQVRPAIGTHHVVYASF